MIPLRHIILVLCLVLVPALPALAGDAVNSGPVEVVVKDDNNNLRAFGGENYRQAPVLGRVDAGEHLWAWERTPGWAKVGLPDGRFGYVHDACLLEVESPGAPGEPDPELRDRIGRFLALLQKTVRTGNFSAVELLLHPGGVVINGQFLADAARPPDKQAPVIAPLWYATDVALTRGTAWELLVTGTRPPEGMRMAWDETDDEFVVFEPGMPEGNVVGEAYPEQGLLPMHSQALRLSPEAVLVPGWPAEVRGYPLAEVWRDDFASAPFVLVYQTGPKAWRLEQADHTGLVLCLEEWKGGLRLRGVMTQAW